MPVRKKVYCVSQEKQAFIEQEIKSMLDKKIIQPSFSSWAVPVVSAKEGRWTKVVY